MYDIIGDIHGHAEPLQRLLVRMGYREIDGVFRHPDRQVIFVGDFIDRGPDNRRVVEIAMRMCQAGTAQAVMGNHEYNALAFDTPHPEKPGDHLRTRSDKNTRQHQAFLDQFAGYPDEKRTCLDWFRTLPLFLELPGLRVVHACWDDDQVRKFGSELSEDNCLNEAQLVTSSERNHWHYRAVDILLKGLEVALPQGRNFTDKDGTVRDKIRVKWWLDTSSTDDLADLALGPGNAAEAARGPVPANLSSPGYSPDAPPVFFGHYWMDGTPAPAGPNAACLDYSVARPGGQLVAYRWNGERRLEADRMMAEPSPGSRSDA